MPNDHHASIKAAAVQIFTEKGQESKNLAKILESIDEAADSGARLIVFPEGVNNGYIFDSREEAHACATPVPGPFTAEVGKRAQQRGVYVGIGILEQGLRLDVFNDSLLIDPAGAIAGKYQKTFFIKADKHWLTPGNLGYPVFDTSFGKVGFFICADGRLPEPTRALALNGAQVLLNTSNWGGPDQYLVHVPARGVENHCWVVGASKIKEEPGNKYWGNSFIMDPHGEVLVRASQTEEEIIYADIKPWTACDKSIGHGNDLFADRRPDTYGLITEPYARTALARVLEERVVPDDLAVQLCIVQISNAGGGDQEQTLHRAIAECRQANHKYLADFLILPELFLFDRRRICDNAAAYAAFSRRALDQFSQLAKELDLHLVLSLVEEALGRYYSTAVLVGPEGEIGRYRKVHLWDTEREWAAAGDVFPVFKTRVGYVGMMLGYDGYFPEAARCLTLGGADLICWPCDWHADYEWKYLAPERALENKVTLAAANRLDSPSAGPSLLIQPLGFPITTLNVEKAHGVPGVRVEVMQFGALPVEENRAKHGPHPAQAPGALWGNHSRRKSSGPLSDDGEPIVADVDW